MFITAEQLPIQSRENFNVETRFRNDTITWLAETLHGSMRTSFDYQFDGNELYSEDGGAMGEVFDSAIVSAKQIVELNPSLLFELRRRISEKGEYQDMIAVAKGELPNTMVVVSDFPEELITSSENVGGYNPSRKQTMLRVISRQTNGDIRMVTQSLDRSDRQALEAIYEKLGVVVKPGELLDQRINLELPEAWQEQLVNNLLDTYDLSLTDQFGSKWHAGIEQVTKSTPVNTAEFVEKQSDLINWFVGEKLDNPKSAEKLRYGLAATIKERFNKSFKLETIAMVRTFGYQPLINEYMNVEINNATLAAVQKGETFSGCGTTVGLYSEGMIEGQLQNSGYGEKAGEDKYGSLEFKCKNGCNNTRPKDKLIEKCQKCGVSVRC